MRHPPSQELGSHDSSQAAAEAPEVLGLERVIKLQTQINGFGSCLFILVYEACAELVIVT